MVANQPGPREGESLTFDVCIVGAGPAGITIARSLPGSLKIALIEAGGFDFSQSEQDNYDGEATGLWPGYLSTTRARMFGGSSNCWGGRCLPLDAYDLQRKDWIDASVAWPLERDELIPFYDKASKLLGLQTFFANYGDQKSHAKEDLQAYGFALVPFQISRPPMRFGTAFREEILRSENISLFLHSNARAFEGGSGGAVRALDVINKAKTRFKIDARCFVLATGGIENARVLLNSTGAHPNGLGNQHDQLGRYFMSHTPIFGAGKVLFADSSARKLVSRVFPRTGPCFLALSDETRKRERLLNAGLALKFGQRMSYRNRITSGLRDQLLNFGLGLRLDPSPSRGSVLIEETILRFTESLGGNGDRAVFSFYAVPEAAPDPDNRVSLSTRTDEYGVRKVRVNYQPTATEGESFDRSLSLMAHLVGRHALGRMKLVFGPHNPAKKNADEHHMGTTRMHDDPRRGVVDRNCVVHGVANLYVAGSSVFPSSGFANPTFTILALAHRIADHISRSAL